MSTLGQTGPKRLNLVTGGPYPKLQVANFDRRLLVHQHRPHLAVCGICDVEHLRRVPQISLGETQHPLGLGVGSTRLLLAAERRLEEFIDLLSPTAGLYQQLIGTIQETGALLAIVVPIKQGLRSSTE